MRSHQDRSRFRKLDIGEDPIGAALREANEELSIEPGVVKVIGPTDAKTGTGYNITPFWLLFHLTFKLSPTPQKLVLV